MTTCTVENRENFFARLTPFMAPSELRNVEIAYMMAKFGHRAQFRKELDADGNPVRYFEHVRRVALVLLDELHIRDPEMICTALLHDCLEDTKDVTEGIIEHLFGRKRGSDGQAPLQASTERRLLRTLDDLRRTKGLDHQGL